MSIELDGHCSGVRIGRCAGFERGWVSIEGAGGVSGMVGHVGTRMVVGRSVLRLVDTGRARWEAAVAVRIRRPLMVRSGWAVRLVARSVKPVMIFNYITVTATQERWIFPLQIRRVLIKYITAAYSG